MKKLMQVAVIGMLAMTGCVSIESTRAQLNSNNPSEIEKAEETIMIIAKNGCDPYGLVQFNVPQRIEYVKLLSNRSRLESIMSYHSSGREGAIAIAAAQSFYMKECSRNELEMFFEVYYKELQKIDKNAALEIKTMIIQKMKKDDIVDFVARGNQDKELLNKYCELVTNIQELMDQCEKRGNAVIRKHLKERLNKEKDVASLVKIRESLGQYGFNYSDIDPLILSMIDEIKDFKIISKLFSMDINGYQSKPLLNVESRLRLLKNISEDNAEKIMLERINSHHVSMWNNNILYDLETGIQGAKKINDRKIAIRILASVVKKISAYRQECEKNLFLSWEKGDDTKAKQILSGISGCSDAEIGALICLTDKAWSYLLDKVSADCAYAVLTKGKAKSRDLEEALVKKLPQERIDIKVFTGLKTDLGKRAALVLMSETNKKMAQKLISNAAVEVIDKANVASKNTFELKGFYLGMDFEDVKKLITYHFPDIEFAEMRDGNDDHANYVIRIDKQSTYFCIASAKDKKVFLFNFGKTLLNKWYKYDVQSYMDWANKYESEHGIDMRYKMINSDTVTTSNDRVWFHQESYQYKHNIKEYRLTYFGEEKDWTFEGGIAGKIIKAEAASAFRYIRADAGTLRAEIERD